MFADNCAIYREIMYSGDVDKLQTDLDRLMEWMIENEMEIIQAKLKQ